MEDPVIHMTCDLAFSVLLLSDNASDKDVESKYRMLARTLHPDNGGNTDKWLLLTSAHEYLLASDKRTRQTERQAHNFEQAIGLHKQIDTANKQVIEDLMSRNKKLLAQNKEQKERLAIFGELMKVCDRVRIRIEEVNGALQESNAVNMALREQNDLLMTSGPKRT
jgi:DnaJ-class molecular chaperone